MKLFDALISPILFYASGVLGIDCNDEERVSENHSDYFWTDVTRCIHRVTSCEFMEWRKCKCSLFSKYPNNLVGCKVT